MRILLAKCGETFDRLLDLGTGVSTLLILLWSVGHLSDVIQKSVHHGSLCFGRREIVLDLPPDMQRNGFVQIAIHLLLLGIHWHLDHFVDALWLLDVRLEDVYVFADKPLELLLVLQLFYHAGLGAVQHPVKETGSGDLLVDETLLEICRCLGNKMLTAYNVYQRSPVSHLIVGWGTCKCDDPAGVLDLVLDILLSGSA